MATLRVFLVQSSQRGQSLDFSKQFLVVYETCRFDHFGRCSHNINMATNHGDSCDNEIATANVNISTPEFLDDHRVAKSYNNNTSFVRQAIAFTIVSHLQKYG